MTQTTISRLGLWCWLDGYPYAECIAIAQQAEQLGYGALWIPEAVGRDPFVSLAVLARETDRLRLATGIANIYARDAMAMNAARQSLDELSKGRLILGLGVSHSEMVSGMRHHDYGKPVATMRRYLEQMDSALYAGPAPQKTGLRVLAALREKMLGLAAETCDGAHPYFVTPEHTARARAILGPGKWLAPEQKVLLIQDASEARAVARKAMATYLDLQNYRNNLLTLGFTQHDFEQGGSDRLVDAIVAWGDERTIRDRIEAHWRNGADHVCIQTLRPDGQFGVEPRALQAFASMG
ncbi:MAG TPA: TIGR03620 family F420-dependent LLM class oxidoreductase [Spongiibacteraceae bacterium]|jgi:probable F420-dependent oxidoreductase|nr:TIGR03620 family F420-dependent LLM class oxidoreductase [Spongiibacteraceae bacterium]HUH37914.1 TIGR03620 family F420-dependent LLM class oxidoreductase [Spongiibacteraceae bacterium]